MTKVKNLIKISGIAYMALAMFFIKYIPVYAGILLVIGVLLLSYSFLTDNKIMDKKVMILIIAIISLILNLISSILLFIAFSEITSNKKNSINSPPTNKISNETKKIDLLLKIGLGMVLIAGILFATTTWEFITDIMKIIALIIMGVLFLGLSFFSDKVLKIEKTTKGYFSLGLSFFVLTFIGIGYFAPFSEWFSYSGEGSTIVFAITYLLISLALYAINYKFKDNESLYLAHTGIYITLFYIFRSVNVPVIGAILMLVLLTFAINLLSKNENSSLQRINKVATYMYFPIILNYCTDNLFIVVALAAAINIIDMLYQCSQKDNVAMNIITSILSFIIMLTVTLNIPYALDNSLIAFMIMTIYVSIINLLPLSKKTSLINTNEIIYNVLSLIIVLNYIYIPTIESVIVSATYLIINILNSLKNNTVQSKICFYYQPIVIILFIMNVLGYINENITEVSIILVPAICSLIYVVLDILSKKDNDQKYYIIVTIITTIIAFLCNLFKLDIVVSLITLLASIYLYFRIGKDKTALKIGLYIFALLNINVVALSLLPSVYANILTIMIYLLLTLVITDKKLDVVNYLSFILPGIGLITSISYEYLTYKDIAINLLELYTIFLIVKYFIKDKKLKDVFGTIFYCCIIVRLLISGILEFGIYIGIITLIIIVSVFNKDEYKALFYANITILILNIIIQLKDFWANVPLWIYLLVVGLSLILFVTYKETNKNKRPILNKEKNISLNNKNNIQEAVYNEELNDQSYNKELDDNYEEIIDSTQKIVEEAEKENSSPIEIKDEISAKATKKTEATSTKKVKYCSQCGAKNSIENNFCLSCGNELTNCNKTIKTNNFCAICGEENKNNDKFCKKCGNSLIKK